MAAVHISTAGVLPQSESRAQALARHIERVIADEGLAIGHRLGTKDDLAAKYDVARGTINETLRLLQVRGVIETRTGPNGGVFVVGHPSLYRMGFLLEFDGDGDSVDDWMAIRRCLEPLINEDAAEYRTERDLRDLRTLLAEMEAAIGDPVKFVDRSLAFHIRIAEITPNDTLSQIYIELTQQVRHRLVNVDPSGQSFDTSISLHREMLAAIGSGSRAAATEAAVHHDVQMESAEHPGAGARRPVRHASLHA